GGTAQGGRGGRGPTGPTIRGRRGGPPPRVIPTGAVLGCAMRRVRVLSSRPIPSLTMTAAGAPVESRRQQARDLLAREDDFGVAIVLILLTITVFSSVQGPWGQFVSVALSGGTLLFVLHTAGAHRRTFRASAV